MVSEIPPGVPGVPPDARWETLEALLWVQSMLYPALAGLPAETGVTLEERLHGLSQRQVRLMAVGHSG